MFKKEKLVVSVWRWFKNLYPAANSWHSYIESRPVNSNIRSARLLRDFDRLVSIIQRMRSNMYSNQHYGDRHTIGASIAKHRYNGLIASELTNNITPVHKLILYLHNGASSADILSVFYIAFLDHIYLYIYIYPLVSIENNEGEIHLSFSNRGSTAYKSDIISSYPRKRIEIFFSTIIPKRY